MHLLFHAVDSHMILPTKGRVLATAMAPLQGVAKLVQIYFFVLWLQLSELN